MNVLAAEGKAPAAGCARGVAAAAEGVAIERGEEAGTVPVVGSEGAGPEGVTSGAAEVTAPAAEDGTPAAEAGTVIDCAPGPTPPTAGTPCPTDEASGKVTGALGSTGD